MSKQKYGNIPVCVSSQTLKRCLATDPYSIRFDSILEARTYQILKARSLTTLCQHKILCAHSTSRLPAVYWDCDFRPYSKDSQSYLNIEAKGLSLDTFTLKLHLLERNFPKEIDRLIIVIQDLDTPIPRALNNLKKQIVTLNSLNQYLETNGF